jgi:hypothetical protein
MADQHSTPRYGLRFETSRKRKALRDTASTPIEPAETDPDTAIPADSTSSNVDTSAHTAGQPIQEPSGNTRLAPHQLTIGSRTFIGPTPLDRTTDPSGNFAHLPDEPREYRLFVCDDCPIEWQEKFDKYNLHELCEEDGYPCIWSFPPKAREAFANRMHWLLLCKTLEETRLPGGRLPNLLDEDGKPIVRSLIGLKVGEDPNDVHDEMVRRRYTALIYGYECKENENKAGDDYSFEDYCDESIELRLAMLENMSWRFDW